MLDKVMLFHHQKTNFSI